MFLVGGTAREVLSAYVSAEDSASSADDPLEELRQRYARSELTEAEFARKVERLLETEDLGVPTDAAEREREPEPELESEQ